MIQECHKRKKPSNTGGFLFLSPTESDTFGTFIKE